MKKYAYIKINLRCQRKFSIKKIIVYPFVFIDLVFPQGTRNIIIHSLAVLIQYPVEILYFSTRLTRLKFIISSTGRNVVWNKQSSSFRFKTICRTKAWSSNQHTFITHFRKHFRKNIKSLKLNFWFWSSRLLYETLSTIHTTEIFNSNLHIFMISHWPKAHIHVF